MKYKINSNRYKRYYRWEDEKHSSYNYERDGLLKKIMSRKIVETKNYTLKLMLDYYERSLVFLMKYVDELRNFKNIHWKNR